MVPQKKQTCTKRVGTDLKSSLLSLQLPFCQADIDQPGRCAGKNL